MTTTTDREQLAKRQAKTRQKSTGRAKKPKGRNVKAVTRPTTLTAVAKLRARLALTQAEFARLLAVSVRSLATLESGTAPSEPVARRLIELERLTGALTEVIKRESCRIGFGRRTRLSADRSQWKSLNGAKATGSGRWFTSSARRSLLIPHTRSEQFGFKCRNSGPRLLGPIP